jgi:hypothetical protein
MEIFISWSGPKSGACATALKTWLPCVIQSVKPWCSSEDIAKGARGGLEIAKKLGEVNFGIVCLTPGNLHNEWIHFESGALSKNLDGSALFTLLIDLQPPDVKPPLGHFQHTRATRADVLKLVEAINGKLEKPLDKMLLSSSFDAFWPQLEKSLDSLPDEGIDSPKARPEREILEEILSTVRGQQNSRVSDPTDALRRKARDFGVFAEAFLRGRKLEGQPKIGLSGDSLTVTYPVNGANHTVSIPQTSTWLEAKELIADHIVENTFSDADVPF